MGWLKRRIIEDMEPNVGQPIGTYIAKCDICGTENVVPNYGDWACRQCLQGYIYDECHRIVLADAQLALLRNPPKWIPVSERMPEDDSDVLVCFLGNSGVWCRWTGYLSDDADDDTREWRTKDKDFGDVTPTHWMPLPAPPADAK